MKSLTFEKFEKLQFVFGDFQCLLYAQHVNVIFIFRPAQLEVHLCNGWCKEMHWLNNPALEDCRKLYKVLTGKDSDPAIFQETPIQKEVVQQQPQQLKEQEKKVKYFSVNDRRVLEKFNTNKKDANNTTKPETENELVKKEDIKTEETELVNNLPTTGSIFHSFKARGLSVALKKEIRENGAPWQAILNRKNNSGEAAVDENDTAEKSDTTEKLDLAAAENINVEIIKLDNNFCINHQETVEEEPEPKPFPLSSSPQRATIAQPRKPNRYGCWESVVGFQIFRFHGFSSCVPSFDIFRTLHAK